MSHQPLISASLFEGCYLVSEPYWASRPSLMNQVLGNQKLCKSIQETKLV